MAKMPQQKPGLSEQTVCTPKVLLDALKKRLHIASFSMDLAASADNAVTDLEEAPNSYYDEKMDALTRPWSCGGWNFCNPPFADIEPWVMKAVSESQLGAQTCMLLPASVGSNWWANFVDGCAHVLFLNGRVTFVGHTKPYPKDIAILLYTKYIYGGYEVWDWN